jgi:hypothetical protein
MKKLTGSLLVFVGTVAMTVGASAQEIEHFFRFAIRDRSELDGVTRIISIASVASDTVYAYANEEEWKAFGKLGYKPVELPHPGWGYDHRVSNSPSSMMGWDSYPTYQAYVAMMQQYAANFPSLCKLDTIGLSVQGRLILVLKISKNVNVHEDRPEFLYTSTMHGNETVGYVLLLRLADYLLTQYGQATAEGQRVRNLLDNIEIWLNPLFNPDGTYRLGGDTTVNRAVRSNAHGVDLNRNFPDRLVDSNNTTSGREAETQAMMLWTQKHNFTLSANFHCGVQVANYPWDNGAPSGQYSSCPDDAWFIHLSRVYATPNPDLMGGGFPDGITNGCDWYSIYGGRQDWMYVWNGGREVTVELDNDYNPAGSTLPQRWTNNKESFLAYMEEALKGIRGIVTDAVTHSRIAARVDVASIQNAPVFSDPTIGDYHRLLLPGTYSVIVQAPGYESDTVHSVAVNDSLATRVDVALNFLTSVPGQGSELPAQSSLSQNYPNPFNPTTTIRYAVHGSGVVTLKIYDVLGREVATLVNERQDPGSYTVVWNASGLAGGVYCCCLRVGNPETSSGSGLKGFVATKRIVLLK